MTTVAQPSYYLAARYPSPICPMKRSPDSRSVAEKKYGRHKTSFIRDVTDALKRRDTEFLKNFRVYLKDGSYIEGPQATKKKMQQVSSMRPRVYIATALLESRYWESDKQAPESKQESATKSGAGERGLTRKTRQYDRMSPEVLVELLTDREERLQEKDTVIASQQKELDIKNEQISALNLSLKDQSERNHETNVLMKQLMERLGGTDTKQLAAGQGTQPPTEPWYSRDIQEMIIGYFRKT